MPLAINIT